MSSVLHHTHRGDGPPCTGTTPQVPTENANSTEAVVAASGQDDGPVLSLVSGAPTAGKDRPSPQLGRGTVRSWPLLILALPAAVAVWSGWVGIGQMTGFGQVPPLPGCLGLLASRRGGPPAVGRRAFPRLRTGGLVIGRRGVFCPAPPVRPL